MRTYDYSDELYHHGIKGMRWGVRRYQNSDGSLTPSGQKRLEKRDTRWAKKNTDKITSSANKKVKKELDKYSKDLLKNQRAVNKNGKISAQTINSYNKKMAELMSQKTSNIKAPSGRVVSFVAKRGEVGVFMALSNSGYSPNEFKNGVYDSGRVAYHKNVVNKLNI